MNTRGHHYIKWNKPDSERQIFHIFSQRQTLDLHFYLHVVCLCVSLCVPMYAWVSRSQGRKGTVITGRDLKGERQNMYDTKANGNNGGRGKAMGKERFIRIKYAWLQMPQQISLFYMLTWKAKKMCFMKHCKVLF